MRKVLEKLSMLLHQEIDPVGAAFGCCLIELLFWGVAALLYFVFHH